MGLPQHQRRQRSSSSLLEDDLEIGNNNGDTDSLSDANGHVISSYRRGGARVREEEDDNDNDKEEDDGEG